MISHECVYEKHEVNKEFCVNKLFHTMTLRLLVPKTHPLFDLTIYIGDHDIKLGIKPTLYMLYPGYIDCTLVAIKQHNHQRSANPRPSPLELNLLVSQAGIREGHVFLVGDGLDSN